MIIRNHNFVLDIPFEQIHYIKVQNLDFPVICPICNYEMKIRDSKRRCIKDETGQKIPLNLKRYYCIRCNKLHTEIPDIIEPYKQYDSLTIEKVKSGDTSSFAGDDSTIKNWQREKVTHPLFLYYG